ncbi:DUF397 domain-containing protein [Nocardia sputi]|nr:DUF397 domain-containing protein [Nocardia sputi]
MKVDLSEAQWRKSSHSGGGQECVEVAHLAGGLVVLTTDVGSGVSG